MLRNKMRVRFADKGLSEELCKYLSNNNKTAKLLYRANRTKILKLVMEKGFAYPLTYDTVLHLINHIIVKDKILANFEAVVDISTIFTHSNKQKWCFLWSYFFTYVCSIRGTVP